MCASASLPLCSCRREERCECKAAWNILASTCKALESMCLGDRDQRCVVKQVRGDLGGMLVMFYPLGGGVWCVCV